MGGRVPDMLPSPRVSCLRGLRPSLGKKESEKQGLRPTKWEAAAGRTGLVIQFQIWWAN